MRTPPELTRSFRERGLRITPQRIAVFDALHRSTTHPTAESVYHVVAAEIGAVSLRTVYQTLNDLVAMGEIRCVDVGVGAARFDPNVDDHHHLVCDECGSITDAYLDVSTLDLGELGGFEPGQTNVIVSGRCARCAAAGSATTRAGRGPLPTTDDIHHPIIAKERR